MAKVIGKEQLCSTDLKYFKALQGIGGKTLFDRYSSLENIVRTNIDTKYQDFLAHPIKDGNTITFHGKTYSETPRLLSDLQGEEKEKYEKIKAETLAHFESKIASLKNSGKTTEGEYLENAIKFIDDRFVYCYDDKVVLGVWGMQLRDNVREEISEIRKNLATKKKKEIVEPIVEPEQSITPFTISFNAGENGNLNGNPFIIKNTNSFLYEDEIPQVQPNDGYEFVGWNENPNNYEITGNKEFTAQYKIKEEPTIPFKKLPWYTRFWNWLRALFTGKGCLRWLLWLLLLLLLLLLFSWLLRGCEEGFYDDDFNRGGDALTDNDSTWIADDPNVGNDGGIYDPYNPYQPKPTPPGFEDVAPEIEALVDALAIAAERIGNVADTALPGVTGSTAPGVQPRP